jgi:hypothetical protein
MTDFAFVNSICTEVLALRKNYIHRFAVSEIASSIGALHEDALPEIKQILSRHRRELNIREAGVGGMSWSFGYYPAASSQLIPVPGSPV